MIRLTLFIFIFSTLTYSFSQDKKQKDSYVEISAISKSIKKKEKGLTVNSISLQYVPSYNYVNGVIFGSKLKLSIVGIGGIEQFNDLNFLVYKMKIIHVESQKIMLDTDWKFPDGGKGYRFEGKEDAIDFFKTLKIGFPVYSGQYEWTMIISNFCDKKSVEITVPIKIIENTICMEVEKKNKANCREVYLISDRTNQVVIDGKIPVDKKLKIWFDGITGFNFIDEFYYLGLELKLSLSNGNIIAHAEDLLSDNNGKISFDENENHDISADFSIKPEHKNKKLIVNARLWDKKGEAEIEVNLNLSVY